MHTVKNLSLRLQAARHDVLFLGLCFVFAAMCLQSLHAVLLYTPDSADYLGWAESLSRFRGFVLPFDFEPVSYVVNAPLYSVLLAPLALFFPLSVVAAKAFTATWGIALLWLFYRYASGHTSRGIGLLASLLLVLHPMFLLYSTQVLSEVPFMVLVFASLIVLEKYAERESKDLMPMLGLGVLLGAVVLSRELGVTLVVAIVISLAASRRYKAAWVLFAVPASLYLLWYLRNEGFAAGAEHPALTNTQLFLSTLFTPSGGSFWGELIARLRSNAAFYGGQVGGLLFVAQYIGTKYTVVNNADPGLHGVQEVVSRVDWIVFLLTAATVVQGFRLMVRRSALGITLPVFTLLYSLAVLVYPIADARFLFPLLFTFLIAAAYAGQWLLDRLSARDGATKARALAAAGLVFMLLLIPDCVWVENYLRLSREFIKDPVGLNATFTDRSAYPRAFGKLFPQAAEWVDRHSGDSALVLCQNKEVALWLQGRKVMQLDPIISISNFDDVARDYHPTFMIEYTPDHSSGDFGYIICRSRRFIFRPLYRVGDVRVLSVDERRGYDTGGPPEEEGRTDSLRQQFYRAVRLLDDNQPYAADTAMQILGGWQQGAMVPMYCYALAAEFAGRLPEAEAAFKKFQSMTQAWPYLVHAQKHLKALQWISAAGRAKSPAEWAQAFFQVSLIYWEDGYTGRAVSMIERALNTDPEYMPGLLYGVLFKYEKGDLVGADLYLNRAAALKPDDPAVRSWRVILELSSQLGRPRGGISVAEDRLKICREFLSMGLAERAIDQLHEVLRSDPGDVTALRLLSQVYLSTGRRTPARVTLERLLSADPSDEAAAMELARLGGRDPG